MRVATTLVVCVWLASLAVAQETPAPQFGVEVNDRIDSTMAYTEIGKNGVCSLWVIGGRRPRVLVSGDIPVAPRWVVRDRAFQWSPDGRRIAFASPRDNKFDIYLAQPTGGAPSRVAHAFGPGKLAFDWDPTSRFLSIWVDDGRGGPVFVLDTAEHELAEVSAGMVATRPVWATSQPKLAFVARSDKGRALYVVEAGAERAKASVCAEGGLSGNVWWSPTGAELVAEAADADGTPRVLYMASASGGQVRPISQNVAQPRFADWSPDGRRVAFAGQVGGTGLALYLATAPWAAPPVAIVGAPGDGMLLEQVGDAIGSEQWAAWSPSGDALCYVAGPSDTVKNRWLYVAGPDGSGRRAMSEPVECRGFRWSPDGRSLLFAGRRGSQGRLSITAYVVPASGSSADLRRLVPNVGHIAWSPDGRYVSYVTFDIYDRNHQLLQVADPTGAANPQRVAEAMEEYAWAPVGR
ncbi:MAG TPA: hypothetical protein PLD23_03435 [Armatimonadota bacterium]|nr:hypothetical protein [Armatimonadota bacterium]HQK92527.1 hypothetical protein [Armatimonadota bacterium]